MFLTNHTLTGAAVGLAVNPWLALPLGFISHLTLDSVPHFGHPKLDLSKNPGFSLAVTDGVVSLGLALLLVSFFADQRLPVSLAIFGATLPDLLYIPRHFFGWVPSKLFARIHKNIQWSESPPGIITEIIWALLMLELIL